MRGGVQCAFVYVSNELAWRDGSEVATGQEPAYALLPREKRMTPFFLENRSHKGQARICGRKNKYTAEFMNMKNVCSKSCTK